VSEQAPIVNFTGEQVMLGPIQREQVPLFLRWMNDISTVSKLGAPIRPLTLEQETAWFEGAATDENRYTFAVYERASGRLIGTCGLHEIDWRNRRTELGILIGEPDARGRGYGTEAMRLLLDYAFTVLGLHSVMLTVYAFNPAARRSYEKAGFREIGRRRDSRWCNGRYWDEIFMDILAEEFESPVLKQLLKAEDPR
jgi:RimJ/RimL family protein N-acetyltransferase